MRAAGMARIDFDGAQQASKHNRFDDRRMMLGNWRDQSPLKWLCKIDRHPRSYNFIAKDTAGKGPQPASGFEVASAFVDRRAKGTPLAG